MALEMSMPIVPLYFAGGLPEEPLPHKLEVPYGHAAQDYIFGRPILPDELRGMPYAELRRYVMDAINGLAPFSDAPHPPNYDVESRITAAAPGASPLESVWFCIEDALDALPVDWRNLVSDGEWGGIVNICGSQRRPAEPRPGQASTLTAGSCVTGKFTELAMKQARWASACNASALSTISAATTSTCGCRTAAVKCPPSVVSVIVPTGRST
jgi:hypothetical protein